jgi:hypothetical protein
MTTLLIRPWTVILREEVDMDANLSVPAVTPAPPTSLIRPDSVPPQSVPTDLTPSQSVTAAAQAAAARSDAARPAAAPTTTQNIFFDPAMLQMVDQILDARTRQVVDQVPVGPLAAAQAYQQTLNNSTNGTAAQTSTAA